MSIDELSLVMEQPVISDQSVQLFCVAGNGRLLVNMKEYTIESNSLTCVLPGFLFRLLACSADFECYLIVFSFDFIAEIPLRNDVSSIMQRIDQHAAIQLAPDAGSEYTALHQLILDQFKHPILYRSEVVKSLFAVMIYKVTGYYFERIENAEKKDRSRQEEIYHLFLTQLFRDYKQQRSVEYYADQLSLTPKYLSKVISAQSGKKPIEWIQQMTIQAAKALLRGSTISIELVAEELTFSNRSFFGTFFKKHTGLTPLQYRSQSPPQ